MKKIISILLISVILSISLCSCVFSDIIDDIEDAVSSLDIDDVVSSLDIDDVVSGVIDITAVKRGVTGTDSYVNESIGLTYNKPTEWMFYTDEQIAEIMNISKELFKDQDLINSAEVTTVIEFMASSQSGANNVNMSIENLAASGNSLMTVEQYAEASKTNLQAQLQITYTFGEDTSVTVAGEEYLRITANAESDGIAMKQYIYLRKVATSMIVITATAMDGASPEYFEEMFS